MKINLFFYENDLHLQKKWFIIVLDTPLGYQGGLSRIFLKSGGI